MDKLSSSDLVGLLYLTLMLNNNFQRSTTIGKYDTSPDFMGVSQI